MKEGNMLEEEKYNWKLAPTRKRSHLRLTITGSGTNSMWWVGLGMARSVEQNQAECRHAVVVSPSHCTESSNERTNDVDACLRSDLMTWQRREVFASRSVLLCCYICTCASCHLWSVCFHGTFAFVDRIRRAKRWTRPAPARNPPSQRRTRRPRLHAGNSALCCSRTR